jgi:hypothetical protein
MSLNVVQGVNNPHIVRISAQNFAYLHNALAMDHSKLPKTSMARHYNVYISLMHNLTTNCNLGDIS